MNVKNAKPLFKGHEQPKIPLEMNYYNLLEDRVKIWQAELAKKYGIYGFCYYHYWFSGKKVLEKPMEQMLANKEIDLPFCICWANEPWTKAWVNESKVLLPQFYGGKNEWKEHFDYLLPFLQDERYIKVDGKLLFIIYRAEVIECLNDMLDYWNLLAEEAGLPGFKYAYQDINFDLISNKDDSHFDYDIEYQPSYAYFDLCTKSKVKNMSIWKLLRNIKKKIYIYVERQLGFDLARYIGKKNKDTKQVKQVKYSEVWEAILQKEPISDKSIPGAFVRWDNSPRKGIRGYVFHGDTPALFKEYLSRQIKRARDKYNKDILFMFAWNEWAEGGFLEPDEKNKYGYLEAVSQALKENNEFPW